jgi:zinc protease
VSVRRAFLLATLAALVPLAAGLGACASLFAKPAWEEPPTLVSDAPVAPADHLHRAMLENGMHTIVLEDPRLPRVVLGVAFRRGESTLPPESAGLASYTAELMERGAGNRGALEFAHAVDRLGATLTASAGWDSLTVVATGLSRDRDTLLDLLADVVLRPRFDAAEAKRARGEMLAALEQAKADPTTLTSWYTAKAVYGGHRFGLPLSGTPETIARLDAGAARAFHARIAMPNDAIFFASGDVEPGSLLGAVRARFGAWAQGTVADTGAPPPAPAPPARKIVVVDRPDMVQTRITVSHDGISRTAEDRVAVALLNSVIGGGGFSSRLMASLRSDEGLTYSVSTDFIMRRSPGPFVASTFTRVPETRRTLDLLLKELERGRTDPPSESELTWARTLAIGSFAMGLETSTAVITSLVDLDVYGLPDDSLDTYRSRVRAVTPEDAAVAAREHLHPDRAAIVLVGPASELVKQVQDLGPVEVVEP